MKSFDRFLQRWRISKVKPYVTQRMRVLDVGSSDGALFHAIPTIQDFVGIDPDMPASHDLAPNARLLRGFFPEALETDEPFDLIAMLAVLEHVPPDQQSKLAVNCARYLKPGGRLVITVPSPTVDYILAVLRFLRVIDGMQLEEHYGFDASKTPEIFGAGGLQLVKAGRFQCGINNLFVFEKPLEGALTPA